MNLYEFEGKNIFSQYGITIPKGSVIRRGDDSGAVYRALATEKVVMKAQVLSGKRGKNNGIRFCDSVQEVRAAADALFHTTIGGQYVIAIRIEECLPIAEEHYLSITYDTGTKQPVLLYSVHGGIDIEEMPAHALRRYPLDVRKGKEALKDISDIPFARELWKCFLDEDARLVEINPLVKTVQGTWVAVDAKIALDDDAFFRHESWKDFAPRTMLGRPPTEREIAVQEIDKGEEYYRGTAGKYMEMDGDIAMLFSGGGASIANMDALIGVGLRPANYTEYSGNPPREKVHKLAAIVLSKPNLRGLWIVGGVANFTDVEATLQGIVDALDEVKPRYPIVVRRAGPHEKEGMEAMRACAERNNLQMKLFGKEIPMSATAKVLAEMVH
ncbi:MAG: ATP citrate lyase citrate-binding domain-containing protein [bacterium]|nr:ATP citrate lyase citrate-binding domain-containing protein [bacterium]